MSSYLRLGLPKGLFPAGVGLPVTILKALLHSSILSTWPAHFSLLDLITLTILGERYKLWISSLWSLLNSPLSSLLGPNIRLRILFSNTLIRNLKNIQINFRHLIYSISSTSSKQRYERNCIYEGCNYMTGKMVILNMNSINAIKFRKRENQSREKHNEKLLFYPPYISLL